MANALQRRIRSLLRRLRQKRTHAQMIRLLWEAELAGRGPGGVFVETGSGLSTLGLAECAKATGARVYSCDSNAEKVEALKKRSGPQIDGVRFLIGDSLANLRKIASEHDRIDLLFLDSAPSALHTFREFQIVERLLADGACVLIDNAALPGARRLLSPCRKGRILVPYLLASPVWEVHGHPEAGDSMVAAVRRAEPVHADPHYEDPAYSDPWQDSLDEHFGGGR